MNIVLCSREDESRILAHGLVLCSPEEAEDYLAHDGVKGMKWHSHRWWNEDKTLTEEGRKHYGIGEYNRKAKKAEKLGEKVKQIQDKHDKELVKANSFSSKVFNTSEKHEERAAEYKRELELTQAKQRIAQEKADRKEANGLARSERDWEREETKRVKEQEKEDKLKEVEKTRDSHKVSLDEYDNAGTEFNDDPEHNKALYDVSEKAIKERIQGTKDWFTDEQYDSKEERISGMKYLQDNFDSLRDEGRKNFGDDLLSYVYDPANRDDEDYDKISSWLVSQVYDKSGSWNADEYKPGSNAEKAAKAYRDISNLIGSLYDEVSKETGFTWGKDYSKLRKAVMQNDRWPGLSKVYSRAESDLLGAMLKDLGFRDTPENRYVLLPFAFLD